MEMVYWEEETEKEINKEKEIFIILLIYKERCIVKTQARKMERS